jgi:hydroxyethylthiazole kinase-like sugar kinase family protein
VERERGGLQEQPDRQALQRLRELAARSGGVVCVSGPVDQVLDANGRHASLANGHEWMTRITGEAPMASSTLALKFITTRLVMLCTSGRRARTASTSAQSSEGKRRLAMTDSSK